MIRRRLTSRRRGGCRGRSSAVRDRSGVLGDVFVAWLAVEDGAQGLADGGRVDVHPDIFFSAVGDGKGHRMY